MKAHALATTFGAISMFVSLTILVVPPVYGQSCTPSSDSDEAARSGASLTNPAGETIVVSRRGERGLDASASAANHGTVITCGEVHEYHSDDGTPAGRRAHAVSVDSNSGDGAAAVNSGLIETRGRGARGMAVFEYGATATATATATNRGRIVTRGDMYDGTEHFGYPHHRTTDGVLVESGRLAGDAVAINERNSANDPQSGVIEVHGTGARGLWVWTIGTGEAKGINRGTITTRGDALGGPDSHGSAAAGIAAQSSRGNATAINEEGATIRTYGDGAPGLFAGILDFGAAGDSGDRTARAENQGTIVVSGDFQQIEEGGIFEDVYTIGVYAHADNGTATVVNTGNVTAAGRLAAGLYAGDSSSFRDDDVLVDEPPPSGGTNATVHVTAGRIVAGAQDNPATPEDESRNGFGIVAESERGRARVMVSGASTTITAHSADNPAPEFSGEGVGIIAFGAFGEDCVVGDTCTADSLVEVSGGATVTADIAVRVHGTLNLYESRLDGRVELDSEFGGSNDHFTIRGGSVHGDVNFHGLDDVLTIKNHGHITGNVDFGEDETQYGREDRDILIFDVNGTGERTTRIDGTITGIEEMYKRGPGTAWVRDVTFSGSALALEEGGLTLAGHLNLGADGTLTVHDESRLTVEVGDITEDTMDHGRITAGGGVVYEGLEAQEAPELFMQIGADATDNAEAIQAQLQQERIDVLGEDTQVLRRRDASTRPAAATPALMMVGGDGTAQNIGTLSSDGTAMVELDEGQNLDTDGMRPDDTDDTDRPRRDDGGSSNAGAILIGGGAAALAVYLFDLFDSEEPALVEWEESWTGTRTTTSFAGIGSGHYREHRVRTGALEQWTRTFAGDSTALAGGVDGAVQGVALGLDARLSEGFHVGASMMPDMAASTHRGPALNFGANAEGGRYALHGGWSGDALFVDAGLSHGSYRTQSLIENPAVGGLLGGELNLTQDRAQGRAGMRLDLGRLRATPSVSLFSGSLRQGAYTARGAAVSAEVPGFSQRYAGWRAKLDLAPSGWLDGPGTLSWRPSLHLGTTRTRTSGPGRLHVRQSDHEGVLSFASRAAVKGLPRTVHGIGASLVAARSDAWNFRMGYAGMVVDGEPVHAAVARLVIRF